MEDLETRGLTRSSEWVVVNAGEGSEIPQKKGTINILYLRIDFFIGKTHAWKGRAGRSFESGASGA